MKKPHDYPTTSKIEELVTGKG